MNSLRLKIAWATSCQTGCDCIRPSAGIPRSSALCTDQSGQPRGLVAGRRASESRHEHPPRSLVGCRGRVRQNPPAPMPSQGDDQRIVEQGQRLVGHVGRVAPARGELGNRLVEQGQKPRRLHQRHLQIEAAPAVAIQRAAQQAFGWVLAGPVGVDRRPAQPALESARHHEHRIANRFGVEPAHRPVVPEAVFGVERQGGLAPAAALPPRRRADQPRYQFLERPAVLDELGRQMVEQLRMDRRLAQMAKIVGRADQPLAEQIQPHPVHQHAGGQRIAVVGNAAGQLQSAARLRQARGSSPPKKRMVPRGTSSPNSVYEPRTAIRSSRPSFQSATEPIVRSGCRRFSVWR